jgi:hypothetical protein
MPYKDREKHREYRQQREKEMWDWLQDYKLQKGCADCGYKDNPAGMEFDHLSDKLYNVSAMARYSKAKVLAELDKCDVVCGTCHNIRTFNRRHGV